MLNSIKFYLHILRNRITTPAGNIVPVIKRSYPLDKSPCICLDDSAGATVLQKFRKHEPKEYIVSRTQSNINIHLYCDKEDERDYILDKIMNTIKMCEQDHYTFCPNIRENNYCTKMGQECGAIWGNNGRAMKDECPDPLTLGYKNPFTQYNIFRDTLFIEPPFTIDDLTKKPPLLHSVLKTSMIYDDKYLVGGKVSLRMHQNTTVEGDP